MKRVISGAAVLMLGLFASQSARADNWAGSLPPSHAFAHFGSVGDIVGRGQGAVLKGRSNLGVYSSDEEDRIAPRRRGRSAAARTRSRPAGADRPTRRARRSRPAQAASLGGGGGASGMASYYWRGQRVASGGWFNPEGMTAAHKTLPFGTRVRVTNTRNGRSAIVRINDRGPFIKGRIIDLSRGAARAVGMINSGVAPVRMEVLGR